MRVPGLVLALSLLAVPTLAHEPSDAREAYRRNLTACVTRGAACDRSTLSPADRNYLRFEMGEQRFGARDAEDVVLVRMEAYDQAPVTIVGKSTGAAAAEPAATQAPPGQGCMVPVRAYTKRDGTVVEARSRRRRGC